MSLGERMIVPATEVVAGDFTTRTGYRCVVGVDHVLGGRGSKRRCVEVRLQRYDGGHTDPLDRLLPDAPVVVYRGAGGPSPHLEAAA